MSKKARIRSLRPEIKLGTHTENEDLIVVDRKLRRWGKQALKTRDALCKIPKKERSPQLKGSIAYYTNFVSAVEFMRYQNCRKIASKKPQRAKTDGINQNGK